ncbi:MAG: DUF4097 domain-containing protein [Treponema sp.]|nr:DUF4097 domain-containing protein [Treponema sp.]
MMKKSFLILSVLFITLQAQVFAQEKNLIVKSTYNASDIIKLDFNLTFENVKIQKIYGDEFSLEIYSNNKKKLPTYTLDDGVFKIYTSIKRIFNVDNCKICLYVPDNYKFENVSILTASGDVELSDLNSAKISITSASGDIDLKNTYSDEELNIHTASGDVDIEDLNCQSLTVKSASGDIETENIQAQEVEIKSISGSIETKNYQGEYICLESSSGEIKSNSIKVEYFTLGSLSGDIYLLLNNAPIAASSAKSNSGDIEIYLPSGQGFDLIASSNSGRLHDEINDMSTSARGTFENSYYGGGAEITVKTSSGDIRIGN